MGTLRKTEKSLGLARVLAEFRKRRIPNTVLARCIRFLWGEIRSFMYFLEELQETKGK